MSQFNTSNSISLSENATNVTASVLLRNTVTGEVIGPETVSSPTVTPSTVYEPIQNLFDEMEAAYIDDGGEQGTATGAEPDWRDADTSTYRVLDFAGRKFAYPFSAYLDAKNLVNTTGDLTEFDNAFNAYSRIGIRQRIQNATLRGGCILPAELWTADGGGVFSQDFDTSFLPSVKASIIDENNEPEVDPYIQIHPFINAVPGTERFEVANKFRFNFGDHWPQINRSKGDVVENGVVHTRHGDDVEFGLHQIARKWKVYSSEGFSTGGVLKPFGTSTKRFFGVYEAADMGQDNPESLMYGCQYLGYVSTGNTTTESVINGDPGETIEEHELKFALVFDNNFEVTYNSYGVPVTEKGWEKFLSVHFEGYSYNGLGHDSSVSCPRTRGNWEWTVEVSDDGQQVFITTSIVPPVEDTGSVSYPRMRDYKRSENYSVLINGLYSSRNNIVGFTVTDDAIKTIVEEAMGVVGFEFAVDGKQQLLSLHADANLTRIVTIVKYEPNKTHPGTSLSGHYIEIDHTNHEYGKSVLTDGFKWNYYLDICFMSPMNIALNEGEYKYDLTNKKIRYKPTYSGPIDKFMIGLSKQLIRATGRASDGTLISTSDIIFENCDFALATYALTVGDGRSALRFYNCFARIANFLATGNPTVISEDTILVNMVQRGFACRDGSILRRTMILNAQEQSGCLVQSQDDFDEIRPTVVEDCFFYMGATTHGQGMSLYKSSWMNALVRHNIFYDCKRCHSAQIFSTFNPDAIGASGYRFENNLSYVRDLLYEYDAGQAHIAHQSGDQELPTPTLPSPTDGTGEYPSDQVQQIEYSRNTVLYDPKYHDGTDPLGTTNILVAFGIDNQKNKNSQLWASNNVTGSFRVPNTNHLDADVEPEDLPWNNGHDHCSNYVTYRMSTSGGSTGTTEIDYPAIYNEGQILPNNPADVPASDGGGPAGIRWENMYNEDGSIRLTGAEIKRIFQERDNTWHTQYPIESGLVEPVKIRDSANGPFYPTDLLRGGSSSGGGGGSPGAFAGKFTWTPSQNSWVGKGDLLIEDPSVVEGEIWVEQLNINASKFWEVNQGPNNRGLVFNFSGSTEARDAYLSFVADKDFTLSVEIIEDTAGSNYSVGDIVSVTWPAGSGAGNDVVPGDGLAEIRVFTADSAVHDRADGEQEIWPFGPEGSDDFVGENVKVTFNWGTP